MRPESQSSISKNLLLGLPIPLVQQGVSFSLFLGMYLTTVLGNLFIILFIRLDSRLHTLFSQPLGFTDISLSSIVVPTILINVCSQNKSIPYAGCISQMYLFINFSCIDRFILGVMAYDRNVATCHPLHYTIIMRDELCIILLAGSWYSSCSHALLHTLLVDQLSFCASTLISLFFSDLAVVLSPPAQTPSTISCLCSLRED